MEGAGFFFRGNRMAPGVCLRERLSRERIRLKQSYEKSSKKLDCRLTPKGSSVFLAGLDLGTANQNGDEVEYTVVLFECSAENPLAGTTNDETDRLEYFAPEEMPALELPYPIQIFSNLTGRDVYFEPA
jgi:hypothetical protein